MPDVESLQAYAGELSEAAKKSTAASSKQHEYVHGDDTTDVQTESGPVPSLAKQAKTVFEYLTSLGSFLQKGLGAIIRSWLDKMQEVISVKDFGAVEGGKIDCTQAFHLAGPGAYVPKGDWLVDPRTLNLNSYTGPGRILTTGGQRLSLGTPLLDGVLAQRLGGTPKLGWMPSGEHAQLYPGSGNATQGIAWVIHKGIEKLIISQRVGGSGWTADEMIRFSEWRWTGNGDDMEVVSFSEPLSAGHGSDLTALVQDGELYLYTTWSNTGTAQGGISKGGKGFTKVLWRGAATTQEDVQAFRVFGDPIDTDGVTRLTWPQSTSVCVSNDGKYVVAVSTSFTGTGRFLFLYDREEVEAAGADARTVGPITGPLPIERAPGEFGSTLQGLTSDGKHIYTVWGLGAVRAVRTVQVYDMSGRLRRTFPFSGAGALYSESELMGLGPRGIPVSFEPEGICLMGDELITLSIDAWKTPQDVVPFEGKNWACINTTATAGKEPTNRSNWIVTQLPATTAYADDVPYVAGGYTYRQKRVIRIKMYTGELGESKLQNASTDATTGTIKEYFAGTDVAFNAENGSFTFAKFYEALGTYKKFMELNYNNTLNLFSTAAGSPNNRWVSFKSAWTASMYGLQVRSSGGEAAGGANLDLHAVDCPAAPGEMVASSTESAVVRFRNGSITAAVLSAAGLVYYGGVAIRATTDNVVSLGRNINRFSQVWAGTGTINTSDATEKTPISKFSQAHINAGLRLIAEVGAYQWLQEIINKGPDVARIHFGTTVQRAIEIFEEEGLDPYRFGAVCLDEWEAHTETLEPAELDEAGNVVREAVTQDVPAGRRFGFRDHQVQYLMLSALAANQKTLDERLLILEQSTQS